MHIKISSNIEDSNCEEVEVEMPSHISTDLPALPEVPNEDLMRELIEKGIIVLPTEASN